MKAGYFNPKSINTGDATWTREDSIFKIYSELRDENYPGSKYDLTYILGQGLLAVRYFKQLKVLLTMSDL